MSDTVFRTQQASEPATETVPAGKEATQGSETNVEVPYLDYQQAHGKPYVADHFQLGDAWSEPVGGFEKEVTVIEGYIKNKVESGEIANDLSAIRDLLKGIEKTTNVSKETRPLVKVETIAAYIEFLMKTDHMKSNLRRYANS